MIVESSKIVSMPTGPKEVPRRRTGAVISAVLATLSIAGVFGAFILNASPYGTFDDARETKSSSMHIAGSLLKETIEQDMAQGQITFKLRDTKGEVGRVVYHGPKPANMGEADTIVAIGGYREGAFHSEKLLIKCPSKSEGEKKQLQGGA
jgi:cytochrome c-type biogenesis protein CcmE